MKARNTVTFGLLAGLLIASSGTTCGAKLLPSKRAAAPVQAQPQTPELAAADERVAKAKSQVETARKQLDAAKALLKAAEADYKAAIAQRAALALQTHAQGLAEESGLNQVASRPAATSSTATTTATTTPPAAPADTSSRITTAASEPSQDLSQTRIQQGDFNSEAAPSEPIQLR